MLLPPNYLEREGYRLPTEAEWEYACRGGTITACFFGEEQAQLDFYGHLGDDGFQSVGMLRPNAFGLFDTYGNVLEWCQDRSVSRSLFEDRTQIGLQSLDLDKRFRRVTRGSAYFNWTGAFTSRNRSASRNSSFPESRAISSGLRVARTIPLEKPTR